MVQFTRTVCRDAHDRQHYFLTGKNLRRQAFGKGASDMLVRALNMEEMRSLHALGQTQALEHRRQDRPGMLGGVDLARAQATGQELPVTEGRQTRSRHAIGTPT
jgi:hypothetical protein